MKQAQLLRETDCPWLAEAYGHSIPRPPIIGAVCSGQQPGWIWGDNSSSSGWALVVHQAGFCQLLTQRHAGLARSTSIVERLMTSPPSNLPGYLMWYSPPANVLDELAREAPQGFQVRDRLRWNHAQAHTNSAIEARGQGSSHSCVVLNSRQVQTAEHTGLIKSAKFWGSPDLFVSNARAHGVITTEGEVLSVCYAAAIYAAEAEIDIVTLESARGRGHALRCAAAFIQDAQISGITPTWDCFTSNLASMELARRLGFQPTVEYQLATFKRPTRQ